MSEINNEFYHDYGDKWYTAFDDPIALLRIQGEFLVKWMVNEIIPKKATWRVLDMGCGGGLVSNELLKNHPGVQVTGVDLSSTSLAVAGRHDPSKGARAEYLEGDVTQLPDSVTPGFDFVYSMDVLEHVHEPQKLISEAYRMLKPGGLFIAHTFNRNPLAHLVVIKGMEWFVKNTPKNLHVIDLFWKPSEVRQWCQEAGFQEMQFRGLGPKILQWDLIKMITKGVVPATFRFDWHPNTLISYLVTARKPL